MLTLHKKHFPTTLTEVRPFVSTLFYQGESLEDLLQKKRVGVVGSRKMSAYGKAVTTKISKSLAEKNVVIVSGLALGVDSVAHRACLEAKCETIAVLPCGLDRIYPTSHQSLALEISKNGALVSEYPEYTVPLKYHFIARNRIIAGLSDALIVTEAGKKSGSIHTAMFALELGIPVFAIPGNITSPYSEGTNELLKQGALPLTNIKDIAQILNINLSTPRELTADNETELCILTLLSSGINSGFELHARSGLDISVFNTTLSLLEIKGKIIALGGNNWAIV